MASTQKPLKFPYPSKVYAPLNRCLYCTSTQNLSKEHIIPLGLGGELIVPKASCEVHQKATSKVEDFVLRKYLCALRSHLGLPSRNPCSRPDGYTLKLFVDPPGRVIGCARQHETWSVRFVDAEIFPDIAVRLTRLGADAFEDKVTIKAMALARLIAKIGHCFALAELGFDAFEEPHVAHLIGAETQDWNYWVGRYDRGQDVPPRELHELRFLRRGNELSVIVHLLVPYCPRYGYEVIVGRLRPDVEIPAQLDESVEKEALAKG
jgi:hypothetical protein